MRKPSPAKVKWETWSPQELVEAYADVENIPASRWAVPTLEEQLAIGLCNLRPSLWVTGIDSQANTLRILRLLATDIRLRDPWRTVNTLRETAKRDPESRILASRGWLTPDPPVFCRIAQDCVLFEKYSRDPSLVIPTVRKYKQRHAAIAKTARKLAALISYDGCVDAELDGLGILLDKDAISRIVGNDCDEGSEKRSRSHWLRGAIEDRAPPVSELLNRIAELADIAGSAPPPNITAGYAQMLAVSLSQTFEVLFSKPLDDVASVTAEVVFDTEVSPDSLKTRRARVRKHRASVRRVTQNSKI